jgi:N-acetylglucosaminyldiphosphoundecaprenol N-acetyl-beta-D-mannosaminyltransferase
MKKRILSIDVNYGTRKEYFKKIIDSVYKKEHGYVCFSNVHMLIEAYDNPDFANVVNNSKYAFADGVPIAKSFKYLHNLSQERISGMDFLPAFLEVCNSYKFKVAFLGSTTDILDRVKQKINEELPNVVVTALISPPFGKQWNNEVYIDAINKSNTNFVFVALGCPKQEKWMHDNFKNINAILFGIGGALPTYVDEIKRAPLWMQKHGLEWFFRLIKEPRRMFKRYLYTNSRFLFILTKARLIYVFSAR